MTDLKKDTTSASEEILPANKMGTMPVNKLLLSMSVPMMLSMLVQAMYNIVDSIFVAQINEDALTALSLAFPIQTLMIAILGGTSVGINAFLSKALGQKKQKQVDECANNAVFLIGIIYIVFFIIGLTFVKPFYLSQTKDTQIVEYGIQYLSIICCGSIGICMQFVFEKLLQSTGKTVCTMATQMTGAIINIILDPILIFGYFGFPKLGVIGASVATIAGQIIAGIIALILNLKLNKEIHFNLKGFRPSGKIIGQIYIVGVPSIIMQSIGSVMVYGMNKILISFTSTATAVFGVYYKLQSFVLMPVFGLNNGMVPIVAYNYGAQNKERLVKTVKLSVVYAMGIMMVGLAIFQVFPDKLLGFFDASDKMLEMGIPALKIISLHFIFAGFDIIGTTMFQALGSAIFSMFISICRQLVALLPAAYLLSKLGKVNYVWWAFPIAEIMAVIITIIFMIHIYKKVIKPIPSKEKVV
ncbi:MAG: MATE family efflux transporter [Lachnospiraceae bacterium]|nr:MATE family efflux transporter [Lachnospiraceae bacterium]